MSLDDCYNQNVGKALLIPGGGAGNEGQCVQWADTVLHDVYGLPYHWGNAIDWWNSPSELLNNFNKVTDGSIKKGDFVIFNQQVGSVYGHIDVAMQDGTTSNFQGADSNWGGNKTVHLVQHSNPSYVLGSLRLKGDNMPGNADNYTVEALSEAILGRSASTDQNLQNNIGRPVNDVIDTIRFYPEAKVRAQKANDYDALLAKYNALVANGGSPTQLKPGLYKV